MLLHVTQQLRDKRDRAAALAAFTADLEKDGITIVEAPGYNDESETLRVSSLNRADGEPATEEDGNAVYINQNYHGEHATVPVIVGWKELGFTPRHTYSGYGTSAPKGPMTEEQKAERKTLIENNKLMQSVLLTELR